MTGKEDPSLDTSEIFDFSKLTNENFWKEILSHSIKAFLYTIRKFWYLFILTGFIGLIIGEIIYSMQVDKYHLSMTLRYGSIKNGLSSLKAAGTGLGGAIGVGVDKASLGAVESFGSNFDGVPTPADTINNFGFNLKDFLVIVRGRFVSPESFKEKARSKRARITSFDARSTSSLAYLNATGANKKEVLLKAKELSDFLESLFNKRKRVIIEKIDERLIFSREEYKLVSNQIKHIHKLEREFGRTAEIIARKNTLYTQELSLRATLSEILSFKGENYIKDFEILSMNVSSVPSKFLGRKFVTSIVLIVMMLLTSICIIVLVFLRLKKIRDIDDSNDDNSNESNSGTPPSIPESLMTDTSSVAFDKNKLKSEEVKINPAPKKVNDSEIQNVNKNYSEIKSEKNVDAAPIKESKITKKVISNNRESSAGDSFYSNIDKMIKSENND